MNVQMHWTLVGSFVYSSVRPFSFSPAFVRPPLPFLHSVYRISLIFPAIPVYLFSCVCVYVEFFRGCIPIICGNVTFLFFSFFSLTYLIFKLDIISATKSFCVQLKCLCFFYSISFSRYIKKMNGRERERYSHFFNDGQTAHLVTKKKHGQTTECFAVGNWKCTFWTWIHRKTISHVQTPVIKNEK